MDANITKRLAYDHSAMLYQEKFDTWLNLRPLVELRTICENLTEWPVKPVYHKNVQILGYRTLQGLRDARISPSTLSQAKITPLLPSLIIRDALSGRMSTRDMYSTTSKKFFRDVAHATELSLATQVEHLLSAMPTEQVEWTKDCIDQYSKKVNHIPPEMRVAYAVYNDVLSLMVCHKRLSGMAKKDSTYVSHEKIKLNTLNSIVWVTPDLIIWDYGGSKILLQRSGFLEIFNKLAELQSVLTYSWFQTGTSMTDNHYRNCVNFWRHIATVVSSFFDGTVGVCLERENKGFAYTKCIEGLGVSELIRRGDEDWGWTNDKLGQTLWDALYNDGIVRDRQFKYSELKYLWDLCSVETIAEILGTVKIVGHPTIEIEAGLDDLYEKTHRNLPINQETLESCVGILTRDIIRVFFNKYKRYPEVILTPGAHPNLLAIFRTKRNYNSPETSALLRDLIPKDWSKVIFLKNDEFEKMDNRLALLKDKALGLTRSKVVTNWVLEKRMKKDIVDSKAILHFLFGDVDGISLSDYLDEFSKDEWSDAMLDYLVIKLTAKELELKAKGRFFGSSPAVERDRRIVQEGNVMRFMSDLIPDQLLTPNELEILKKLVSFRDYRTIYKNCHIINISFDFSSWNNSMRKEVVDVGAGQILDSWFKTSYYNKTMKAYENMLIYYDDGIVKKKWDGQYGGIEGLNQATWSIVFIGGIKYALEMLGYKYSITVKGDDVRAAIIVPKKLIEDGGFERFRDEIMVSIQSLCKDMGWSLNPNESFVSLSLIATSKQYLYNNTWLPASLKKIMKICSHTNGVFVSLEDIISTIFSIAHSACSQTSVVLPAFVTATYTAATVFYRQLPSNQRQPQVIAAMVMWPQILAGPGPLPLQTFFVRGENDMLSASMSLYVHILKKHKDSYFQSLIKSIISIPLSPMPNQKMVLGDPYCIDLESPDRPESVMKRRLRRILQRRVKQPDIKVLLNTTNEHICNSLVTVLRAARPYYAKVMTAIWEATPFYLIEELLSKFTHSSTVMGFFSQMKSLNSMSRLGTRMWQAVVEAAEKKWNFWLKYMIPNYETVKGFFGLPITDWSYRCPTDLSNTIRSHQWGEMRGLTYPSLVTQNVIIPESKISDYRFSYGTLRPGTYSTIKVFHKQCTFETPSKSHHYANSENSKVWLGASTSRKIEFVDIPEGTQSPVLRKLKLLLALRKSVKSLGPSILPVVDRLIRAYTSIPMSELEILTPINSMEHFAHRVPINSFSMTTMPNSRPNISQLCLVNNETFSVLREDTVNRSVNMAARQYFLISLTTFPLQYKLKLSDDHFTSYVASLHNNESVTLDYVFCPYCCADVDDRPISFPDMSYVHMDHLRYLPLVSCGEFETNALITAITNMREGTKMMRLAPTLDEMPPDSRIVDNLRLIISQYTKISVESHSTLKQEQIPAHMIMSPKVDNVLLSEGKKPISSSLVSMNVWRSVDTLTLYTAILAEAYVVFLTRAVGTLDDVDVAVTITTIPPVCATSLTVFLNEVITVSGLAYLNDGLRRAGFVDVDLHWGHHLDQLDVLSYQFFNQHWFLFIQWYLHPEECPFQYSIALFTKDSNMQQGLMGRFNYVFSTYMALIRKDLRISWRVITDVINKLCYLPYIDIRDHSDFSAVREYVMMTWLSFQLLDRTGESYPTDNMFSLDSGSKIDLFNPVLDAEPDDLLILMNQVSTMNSLNIPYHLKSSLPWTSIIARYDDVSAEVENAITKLFSYSINALIPVVDSYIDRAASLISRFCSQYAMLTKLHVYRGSETECERIVKSNISAPYVGIENAPLVVRMSSHTLVRQQEDDGLHRKSIIKCRFFHRDTGPDRQVATQYTHLEIQSYQSLYDQLHYHRGQIEKVQHDALIDGVDFFRVFGNLNKGVVRWGDVMNQISINWAEYLNNSTVIVLGDGGGSISRWLLNKHESIKIIFCDKESETGPGSPMNRLDAPVEFLTNTSPELQHRLLWNGFISGDVTQSSTRSNIKNLMKTTGQVTRLMISDIVPDDLSIPDMEYRDIILGVILIITELMPNGSISLIRLPILKQVNWTHILSVLVSSHAHVHILSSVYDRPELLSFYIMIISSTNVNYYAGDMGHRLKDITYQLGIDVFDRNIILNAVRHLVEIKTYNQSSNAPFPYTLCSRNQLSVVSQFDVCQLKSILYDWTSQVYPYGDHLCKIYESLSVVIQSRLEVIRQVWTLAKMDVGNDMNKLHKLIEEYIVGYVLKEVIASCFQGHIIYLEKVQESASIAIGNVVAEFSEWASYHQLHLYSLSRRFKSHKAYIISHKHVMRLLSWFTVQYYVRNQRDPRDHVWYSPSAHIDLCSTCHRMFPMLPTPSAWGLPNSVHVSSYFHRSVLLHSD